VPSVFITVQIAPRLYLMFQGWVIGLVLHKKTRSQTGTSCLTRVSITAGFPVDFNSLSPRTTERRSLRFVSKLSTGVLEFFFGDTEESLLSHFRRLDPAAQGLIAGTAERLAAG
jgi:hypothetical protein